MIKRDEQVRALLTKQIRNNLYSTTKTLRKSSERRLGLLFEVPIFIQDPLVAQEKPEVGIQDVEVRWEPGLGNGPTNSRFAVVDFNSDTEVLLPPAQWNQKEWRFERPPDQALEATDPASYQFHQVNVWAIVQSVLDYFENPNGLGRPIPWGFEGNRLIVVPHAGFGENAFYDRRSKSLQFYYFGPAAEPRYTCLSHDIVAHETGHAVLDGIRPHYLELSSLETAAFHEYIGDLTAILLAMNNTSMRHYVASIGGDGPIEEQILKALEVISSLAEEFGLHVKNRKFLRSASEKVTLADAINSNSPHFKSTVLTSAMFRVMARITPIFLAENEARKKEGKREITLKQALYFAADNFRRIALQPLDLCPPADIRFIDYARAVMHNDRIANPVDERGYRDIISETFHEWGLCQRSEKEHKEGVCDLNYQDEIRTRSLIYHDLGSIARSRTSAYHFLDDNRGPLRIPYNQDFFIADLYETNKYGPAAKRLPREIVLQYLWREAVDLKGSQFGRFEGQTISLLCGGTLVFDGRGNIISWFRKPGTGVESDRVEGEQRREELLEFVKKRITTGSVALVEDDDGLAAVQSPTIARIVDGELRLEIAPHLRKMDEEYEDEEWTTSL